MISKKIVNMYDLVYSITNTSDLVSNEITNHHKKVAYLAFRIAEKLPLSREQQRDVFIAGLLHDVGAFSTEDRLELIEKETPNMHDHAFIGANILEDFSPLKDIANIIRYHHVPWKNGKGRAFGGDCVPLSSHIIHLADRIVVLIDSSKEIIGQIKRICDKTKNGSGNIFVPELVDTFLSISVQEYIWLDLTYKPLLAIIPNMLSFETVELDLDEVLNFSEILAGIVDFRSPFTANHSYGVAAVAENLASLIGFSDYECKMIRVAGLLHDLGKLAINNEILEKPDKLEPDEYNAIRSHTFYTYRTLQSIKGFETINLWASFHHERLDGSGYPFHMTGENISLGSRIMAVSDIFTAIAEERPYRKGMKEGAVIKILEDMAESNKLCPYVVSVLKGNLALLDSKRIEAQKIANIKYKNTSSIHVPE